MIFCLFILITDILLFYVKECEMFMTKFILSAYNKNKSGINANKTTLEV